MQAYTPEPLREESSGSATPRQRSLDRVAGLVESMEVPVEFAIDIPPFHLPIDVTSSTEELVKERLSPDVTYTWWCRDKGPPKALRRVTGTPNGLTTSWVPLITTIDHVRTPAKAAARPLMWASRPAARVNQG
jgi:hypothetical protein